MIDSANTREATPYDFQCETSSYRVLVVEDSKFFSSVVKKDLVSYGHEVIQAFTLKEATQYIENEEFDFILLDLILPDGEGDEIIDSMPKKLRSKVIVLSGDEDSQRRDYIFKSGILDYFSKTSSLQMVMEDIRELMCSVQQNSLLNILIVDDSTFMRRTLKGILTPKRFNVYEAESGEKGLEILKNIEIHLVLLDYEMPNMDGAQMLEQIKKVKKYLNIPVIMLSGTQNNDVVARVLKHGASDFINKPFVTEELLLKIDLHIKSYINHKRIKQKEHELELSLKRSIDAEKHKSVFLANMSHEIRTPLNAIIGFVDLLAHDETDKKKIDYLNTVQSSGKLLLNLINDILDFSKIENNKLDINKEVFLISDIFDLATSAYEPMVKKKHIKFEKILYGDVPEYFCSDFLRIKQIITNLLGNAIKFTPEDGRVIFEISLSEDKKSVEFSVDDSGIGIAPENHKKVFELFSQAEETTTKKFGGTGLGLSISAKLVELLNGQIGLESALGEGSRFYFTLPIVDLDEKQVIYHKKHITVDKEVHFDHHLLLVEDNKANQKFMGIILETLGFTYDIASDGFEAVEKFTNNIYEAILMDENMPNISGIEATKKILEYEKDNNLSHVPIVALTANALKGDREKFIEAGMDEYLTKPLDKNTLVSVLEKILL